MKILDESIILTKLAENSYFCNIVIFGNPLLGFSKSGIPNSGIMKYEKIGWHQFSLLVKQSALIKVGTDQPKVKKKQYFRYLAMLYIRKDR